MALVGREPNPPDRLGIVPRDAAAPGIQHPEGDLRLGVPLIGREPNPPDRLGIVLGDAAAFAIHRPEVEPRLGVPLLGGAAHGVNILCRGARPEAEKQPAGHGQKDAPAGHDA